MEPITRERLSEMEDHFSFELPTEFIGAHPKVVAYLCGVRFLNQHQAATSALSDLDSILLSLSHEEVDSLLEGRLEIAAVSARIEKELPIDNIRVDGVSFIENALFILCHQYNEKHTIRFVDE